MKTGDTPKTGRAAIGRKTDGEGYFLPAELLPGISVFKAVFGKFKLN
jgi:hypothetical protein